MASTSLPLTISQSKKCTRCGEVQPLIQFHKRSTTRRHSRCRTCINTLQALRWKSNPEKHRESVRRSRAANRQKHNEMSRRSKAAKREKYRESNANYRKAHQEKYKEYFRRWAKVNIEKVRETNRRAVHKRRLLLADTRCDLTIEQWNDIRRFYNYRCVYCGENKLLTQDHIVPVSKGGEHTASNIVPACRSCNSSKGNRELKFTVEPHPYMAS
jgi:5-methylcytosine-specific restriction endonuclease McrA